MSYYDTSYPPSLWATPEPVPPVATALVPATGVVAVAVNNFRVNGTGFVDGDSIVTNGTVRSTTFVSDTALQCTFTPSTVGSFPVLVRSAAGDSNSLTFSVTAADEPESVPESDQPEQSEVEEQPESTPEPKSRLRRNRD